MLELLAQLPALNDEKYLKDANFLKNEILLSFVEIL